MKAIAFFFIVETFKHNDYKLTLSDSRIGIYMSVENFNLIDTTISNGISKGQSIEHILHSNNLGISTKSVYIYLNRGYFKAKPIGTHRMVRLNLKDYKRTYNSIIFKKEKTGRNYDDFRRLFEANTGRPVYHRLDNRIVAHFMICYTSLLIYRLLEKKLKEKRYHFTIKEIMTTLKI